MEVLCDATDDLWASCGRQLVHLARDFCLTYNLQRACIASAHEPQVPIAHLQASLGESLAQLDKVWLKSNAFMVA